MNTKEFIGTVVGDHGFYCAVGIEELHGVKRKPFVDQRLVSTLEEVVAASEEFDAKGMHSYFALGRFESNNNREASNVTEMRSFFLDLDCGAKKEYPTQVDAINALRKFCKDSKFPRPTMVNSGRGIHVYWPLINSVPRDQWLAVAQEFKAFTVRAGFLSDLTVPDDAARVLRIPGSHNYKDTPANLVSLVGAPATPIAFEVFRDLLGVAVDAKPKPKYTPRVMDAALEKMLGNRTSSFKGIMVKTIAGNGCAQLEYIIRNQADLSEPMWRAGLSVAAYCADSEKAIHKISAGHEGYSREATESKVAMIKGPYRCERFNEYNPNVCTDCQHWGKIGSPISLGTEVITTNETIDIFDKLSSVPSAPVQRYTIPKYPEPYSRGGITGGIYKKMVNKEGEVDEVLVYHNDLYAIRRVEDPEIGDAVVLRLHLPKDGVREFTVPQASMSKEEFRKIMASKGVAAIRMEELMTYVNTWINELQAQTTADHARRQFGWTDDSCTTFVLGSTEITKNEVTINPPSSSTAGLFDLFAVKGTLEGWKETMAFYNRPNFEAHQYMFGLSFGSILMEMTPINGAIFHMYNKESGLGKTTAMYAGASVWGNPDRLVLLERDTYNSKMNRAEIQKNIVMYMDEMTNTAPKDLSDFAYQYPSGQQRNRMSGKANTERFRGVPWKQLCGTTGNTSMLERISSYKSLPKAEAQRVLEHRVNAIHFASKEETDLFSTAIKDHYGHAGIIFVQEVLKDVDGTRKLLLEVQRQIDAAANLKAENRFWSVQAACTITGLMVAKRAGLVDYDIAALTKFIVKVMQVARDNIENMGGDPESVLTDYLAENYSNVLRITSTQDARRDSNGIEKLPLPEATPRGEFVGRYEYDAKIMYLRIKPLKDWCIKYQINYAGLVDSLTTGRTQAKKDKVRLTRGTNAAMAPVDVLVLNCADFMNDDTEQAIAAGAALAEVQAQTA